MFVHEGLYRESVVAICEFVGLDCVWGESGIGVCVWFGALSMHNMYGLSLVWHWHFICGHVHLSSHPGIVWSSG